MRFPLFPKNSASAKPVLNEPDKSASSATGKAHDGRKQIILGLIFISASFIGAVFLLYFLANKQGAKELEIRDMKQELVLVKTEKDLLDLRTQEVASHIGRVIDIDNVVAVSEQIHGVEEAQRTQGSMWINRKTKALMVTLGALNGVTAGSRLSVYDGEDKFATVKIVSALDVVSYAEPVDKELKDFTKDYYSVKAE